MAKYNKILVAFDGSEDGLKALDTAKELTIANEAELAVLYVHGTSTEEPVFVSTTQTGEKFLMHQYIGPSVLENNAPVQKTILEKEIPNRIMSTAKSKLNILRKVTFENRTGKPADEIVNYATNHQTDLIIIGNRGIGAFQKFVMGSVSQKVIKDSDCSVFLVR